MLTNSWFVTENSSLMECVLNNGLSNLFITSCTIGNLLLSKEMLNIDWTLMLELRFSRHWDNYDKALGL